MFRYVSLQWLSVLQSAFGIHSPPTEFLSLKKLSDGQESTDALLTKQVLDADSGGVQEEGLSKPWWELPSLMSNKLKTAREEILGLWDEFGNGSNVDFGSGSIKNPKGDGRGGGFDIGNMNLPFDFSDLFGSRNSDFKLSEGRGLFKKPEVGDFLTNNKPMFGNHHSKPNRSLKKKNRSLKKKCNHFRKILIKEFNNTKLNKEFCENRILYFIFPRLKGALCKALRFKDKKRCNLSKRGINKQIKKIKSGLCNKLCMWAKATNNSSEKLYCPYNNKKCRLEPYHQLLKTFKENIPRVSTGII